MNFTVLDVKGHSPRHYLPRGEDLGKGGTIPCQGYSMEHRWSVEIDAESGREEGCGCLQKS